MNSLVTALPGLVIIFILAGGVDALAGVLFYKIDYTFMKFYFSNYEILWIKIECDECGYTFYIDSKVCKKQKSSLC